MPEMRAPDHQFQVLGSPSNGGERSGPLPCEATHGHDVAVQKSKLFSGVLPQDCRGICVAARIRSYARGETLFMEGDSVQQIFVIKSGFVKITQLGPSGMEAILRLGVPGEMVDSLSLFSASRHFTTAQAIRKCQAMVWDVTAFRAMVEGCPVLHKNVVQILGSYAMELEERFREVATERVALRVARQLLRLAEPMGRRVAGGIEISLSRQELADMTGTTLFTVSRLLSGWEARGMVTPRREAVAILDFESLKAISE